MRAQVSLDAMVSIAAFIALLGLLISAAAHIEGETREAGEKVAGQVERAGELVSGEIIGSDKVAFSNMTVNNP